MSVFRQALRQLQTTRAAPTRWVYAAYDQLTDRVGPLARHPPSEVGLVLVENAAKARRRPYHQQKLALLLANMRTFALEQAALGRAVRYLHTDEGYAAALRPWAKEFGPMQVMRPAEWELRAELAPLFDEGLLEEVPHEGWLTTRSDFLQGAGAKAPWRMDRFYRHVRKATGLLMEGREPVGGKWSFDVENRLPWAGTPPAPAPPTFAVDDVRAEVVELVSRHFGDHPGRVDEQSLPCTEADIAAMRDFARRQIPHFGPYEDAMSLRSTTIFHTRLSALVNLHRVLPRDVIEDTLSSPAPLQSREGLIRQVLGWREFVHHVHEETDGFRTLRGGKVPTSHQPGDAGYAAWRGTEGESVLQPPGLGGAKPNVLSQSQDLPGAFWGKQSGLHCLDHVVTTVLDEGYSHHITRLMVLANIASLLDVEPRQVSDWFHATYVDAFDWVVEPNVLAMGTFGAGEVMTTKPYIAGAGYIDRMSDYCGDCQFSPKRCPLTRLYWAYLDRHSEALSAVPRIKPQLLGLRRRSDEERAEDRRIYARTQELLQRGEMLSEKRLSEDR